MREVEFEAVSSAPVEEIVALYKSAGWWQESPEARSVIPGMIRGSFCFMVARSLDGHIIGMARVISDGCSDAYIQDVTVKASYRSRGIGTGIIEKLVDRLNSDGLEWIGLIAEKNSHKFYERLNFKIMPDSVPMLKTKNET